MDDQDPMIVPGNNRRIQKRRKPRRKLFGKRRKEIFLEHLAATCNVMAAAEAAGVSTATVYAHRMKDPEFRDLWWLALEQGAAKLVAMRLQWEIERAETLVLKGDMMPPESAVTDLLKLMPQLREHARALSQRAVGPGQGRGGPALARPGNDAVIAALAKRLKAFGKRREVEGPSTGLRTGPST